METTKQPEAYIAMGKTKNRQKIYSDNKVYLNSGAEFQIELFNPTSQTIAAKIYLNGQAISNRMLVLKPGERDFLDRYLDSDRRLKFDTYNVEGSNEVLDAIKNNGNVRIEFFKEKLVPIYYGTTNNWWTINPTITIPQITFPYTYPTYPSYQMYTGTTDNFYKTNINDCIGGTTANCNTIVTSTNNLRGLSGCVGERGDKGVPGIPGKIETGRVEQGSKSNQEFNSYHGEFESYFSWFYEYRVMPESYRPVEMKELRHYCSGCGTRIKKSSWRFCTQCGTKLD